MSQYRRENPQIPEGINASEENPLKEFCILVTGVLGALIVAILVLSFFAQKLAVYMPFEWEREVVSAWEFEDSEAAEEQGEDMTRAKRRALQALAEDLIPHMGLPEEMSIRVHYVDSDVPNAFATIGGHVFIHQGLIDAVDSENGLAMVLAHEIAHVQHRHPIQSLSRGVIVQLLLSAVMGSNQNLQAVIGQTGMLTMLSFNREMERESDRSALVALEAHYGHTHGAERFFETVNEKHDQPEWSEFFATHPDTDLRIEAIRATQGNGPAPVLEPLPEVLVSSE
ncbi:MAG: M48 family metallopeptidase [Pseudomonadota bacterium]